MGGAYSGSPQSELTLYWQQAENSGIGKKLDYEHLDEVRASQ